MMITGPLLYEIYESGVIGRAYEIHVHTHTHSRRKRMTFWNTLGMVQLEIFYRNKEHFYCFCCFLFIYHSALNNERVTKLPACLSQTKSFSAESVQSFCAHSCKRMYQRQPFDGLMTHTKMWQIKRTSQNRCLCWKLISFSRFINTGNWRTHFAALVFFLLRHRQGEPSILFGTFCTQPLGDFFFMAD